MARLIKIGSNFSSMEYIEEISMEFDIYGNLYHKLRVVTRKVHEGKEKKTGFLFFHSENSELYQPDDLFNYSLPE